MKVSDSGMPERDYWETLFDIPGIFDRLGIGPDIGDAVEPGCGYGTFTLPLARTIRGTLHTFDIEPAMIGMCEERLRTEGVANVRPVLRDVIDDGFGLSAGSMDAVFLFNILHGENPLRLVAASAKLLRPGGRIFAIHWRTDIVTPRGPELSTRPTPEQMTAWADAVPGLVAGTLVVLPPWHHGVVFTTGT